MSNRRSRVFLMIFCRWTWLACGLKSLRFAALDTEQRLLFTGSSVRLIWNIRGAYLVKVYVDGEKIGSYLPKDYPVIPVPASGRLEVKACGVYRRIRRSLHLTVRELNCREAGVPIWTKSDHLQPPVVQDFLLRLMNPEPRTPQPVIYLKDILLDTPYRKYLETALQERLIQDQFIMEKPNPYSHGN
ncbi:hypothetical protein [Mucilaginibacter sp. 22184]|uniref:hypothetical protein n=1 Tax=Mucilaginibacter sp. 22184 TaxID=3453887 RepID=UPI003F8591FB